MSEGGGEMSVSREAMSVPQYNDLMTVEWLSIPRAGRFLGVTHSNELALYKT